MTRTNPIQGFLAARVPPRPRHLPGRTSRAVARAALAALAALLLLPLTACTIGGSTRLQSITDNAQLRPNLDTVVYAPQGDTGAEVYLTDLPRDLLARGADLSKASGHLVHINMFLTPLPGRTPIDPSASNATIRWIVIADGQIGVYAGGGFVLPSGPPGGDTFAASVKRATLEIDDQTPRFHDALGPSRMRATFRAPKDVPYTRLVAARVEEIINAIDSEPAQ